MLLPLDFVLGALGSGVSSLVFLFVIECFLTIILLIGHGIVDVLERSVVKSHFELDILEVLFFVGSSVLVNDWLVVLEASSSVDPTVCVSAHIFFKLHEQADLA